jgi:hypothetical protein
VMGMASSVYIALDTIGQPMVSARLQWMRLIGGAGIIFPVAYYFRNLETVAITRFLVSLAITPTLFLALMRPFGLTIRDYAVTLWRPIIAGLAMAIVVLALNRVIAFKGNPRLFMDVTAGALSYVGTLMVLWFAVGQPKGPEYALWRRVSPRLAVLSR